MTIRRQIVEKNKGSRKKKWMEWGGGTVEGAEEVRPESPRVEKEKESWVVTDDRLAGNRTQRAVAFIMPRQCISIAARHHDDISVETGFPTIVWPWHSVVEALMAVTTTSVMNLYYSRPLVIILLLSLTLSLTQTENEELLLYNPELKRFTTLGWSALSKHQPEMQLTSHPRQGSARVIPRMTSWLYYGNSQHGSLAVRVIHPSQHVTMTGYVPVSASDCEDDSHPNTGIDRVIRGVSTRLGQVIHRTRNSRPEHVTTKNSDYAINSVTSAGQAACAWQGKFP